MVGTPLFQLHQATLHPPALTAADDDDAAKELPWTLLELEAYVAKRDNATTARSKTWDGQDIQVTLCARRPPRVSYLCVHSAGEINVEPRILATEDDLILLLITVGADPRERRSRCYYMYQADNGSGTPSLDRLPHPPAPYDISDKNLGIMRVRCTDSSMVFLRPHGSENLGQQPYIVAALCWPEYFDDDDDSFVLCRLHSKTQSWTTDTVSLNQQQQKEHHDLFHETCKVIVVGGDAGTMAFVDLWQGILFCDVLQEEGKAIPPLRYVPLPRTLSGKRKDYTRGDARLSRDIALVNGRIKYLELLFQSRSSRVCRGLLLKDGWIATLFSMDPTISSICWRKDHVVDSNRIVDSPNLKLLPKLVNDEGMVLPPFKRVDICQPTLGLHDDDARDIVYITTKVNRQDAKTWIVAVDMKAKSVEGVSQFAAPRTTSFIPFSYVHSKISKYLKKEPGMHGNLEQSLQSSNNGMEGLAEDEEKMILD